jgi:hypothetical protein
MKIKLLFLILALPLLSLGQCMHVDSVYNKTGFDAIENSLSNKTSNIYG